MLEDITASREALKQKIDTVAIDVSLLRADQRKLPDRITENETVLSELRPKVGAAATQLEGLTNRMVLMECQMEDLEGRDDEVIYA